MAFFASVFGGEAANLQRIGVRQHFYQEYLVKYQIKLGVIVANEIGIADGQNRCAGVYDIKNCTGAAQPNCAESQQICGRADLRLHADPLGGTMYGFSFGRLFGDAHFRRFFVRSMSGKMRLPASAYLYRLDGERNEGSWTISN